METPDDFTTVTAKDFFRTICDEFLGEGASRSVYSCRLDSSIVIKLESGWGDFNNILENEVWERIQFTKLAKWFAPCVWLSPCGTVLVQKRTMPIRRDELPEKVPSFFTDMKESNWGIYNGNPVCHDYGLHLMLEKGMTGRLRRADWSHLYE